MKSYTLDIKVGDKVEVGRFRNVMTTVRDIEIDEHGQPVIITGCPCSSTSIALTVVITFLKRPTSTLSPTLISSV